MLLKNAKILLSYYTFEKLRWETINQVSLNGTDFSKYYNKLIYYKASLREIMMTFPDVNYLTSDTNGTIYGVIFGTGNASPTFEDTGLSGDIVTAFTSSNATVSDAVTYADDGSSITHTCTYTLSNTTSNDVTIGEIGIFTYVTAYTQESTTTTYRRYLKLLLDRTALAEPVTIPAGGVGQITYAITMNYPTDPNASGETSE